MVWVWISRIWRRPATFGSATSICTSKRPGRRSASSRRSRRFVMPIISTLGALSRPSILVSNWFTTDSPTPACPEPSPPPEPRALQRASISSNMTTWSSALSPCCWYAFSARSKRPRILASLWPTQRVSSSGPLTISGSRLLARSLAILRATSVLPVPGGPYSNTPFTCPIPIWAATEAGTSRDANARRNRSSSWSSRPPTPIPRRADALSSFRLGRCTGAEEPGGGESEPPRTDPPKEGGVCGVCDGGRDEAPSKREAMPR
mmetsp:Transcript_14072/g.36423  ORF Transcript_14072/g.36423 Transcript_14072/m.36423 type:complete len:262 (+) Transcript_14072:1286-2071(+)